MEKTKAVKAKNIKLDVKIRQYVAEVFDAIVNDPDRGLELNDRIKRQLKRPGRKLTGLAEIKRKYS